MSTKNFAIISIYANMLKDDMEKYFNIQNYNMQSYIPVILYSGENALVGVKHSHNIRVAATNEQIIIRYSKGALDAVCDVAVQFANKHRFRYNYTLQQEVFYSKPITEALEELFAAHPEEVIAELI